MLRSVFILVRPGIPNPINWQCPAILGVVDLALRPYLPKLMLFSCPDRPYLSRLLYCRFPPSRLLCNKPAVDHCCVFMKAHPPRICKQADVRAISLLLHHTPELIFRPAGELIQTPLQPSLSSPKATPWCQCIVVVASNDEESVFRLWASLEKSDGRSRSFLTHIDIGDDRSGIPRDVGGRFGQSEAQRRVLSSLQKIVCVCDVGTDHQPQTTGQQ